VQKEYAEGESSCLAQASPVVRLRTYSNPLPHSRLLIESHIAHTKIKHTQINKHAPLHKQTPLHTH
jgi:5-methylthioribose kinase